MSRQILIMFLLRNIKSRSNFCYFTTTNSSSSSSSDSILFTTQKTHLNFFADYLINSLGFNKQEAISISSKRKVTDLKSTDNLDLVVNLFKKYGFHDTRIKDVVNSVPDILTYRPKTLEPKIMIMQQLGLSGSDLVDSVTKNPYFLKAGLHTEIMPLIDYLRIFLGSDEKVIKALSRSKWLLSSTTFKRRLPANVLVLQNYGLSNENAVKFFLLNPDNFNLKPEWLEDRLHYVEEKLGISPDSSSFIYGMNVVLWNNESAVEKKVEVFRRFGWSDSEVSNLLRAFPMCLSYSEARICDKLDFFMKELGYTPVYITKCHSLLSLSLEKRVRPRNEVLKALKEKKLVKPSKPTLYSITKYPELKFLEFVKRFKNEIPNLYETYINSVSKGRHLTT